MNRKETPVTVIGGYLGAGKTTLLNHIQRHSAGKRFALLVNDFGKINIDADLTESQSGDHCQFGRERETATNGTCTVMEQGASQCLAPAVGSERGKSIQAGFEGGKSPKRQSLSSTPD
jgi:hypothetical protein